MPLHTSRLILDNIASSSDTKKVTRFNRHADETGVPCMPSHVTPVQHTHDPQKKKNNSDRMT